MDDPKFSVELVAVEHDVVGVDWQRLFRHDDSIRCVLSTKNLAIANAAMNHAELLRHAQCRCHDEH